MTFTADKVGTFTFSCNAICGDMHKNMQGTLVVKAQLNLTQIQVSRLKMARKKSISIAASLLALLSVTVSLKYLNASRPPTGSGSSGRTNYRLMIPTKAKNARIAI